MKNHLLDIGNDIIKGKYRKPEKETDAFTYTPLETLLSDYFILPHNYDKHSDVDLKKLHKDIELLEGLNEKFKFILKPEYCMNEQDNIEEIYNLINSEMNPIFFDSEKNKCFILKHLYNKDSFLNQIKDKRFHEYFVARCNLQLLVDKIKKSESTEYSYVLTNIGKIIHSIDSYILQYLLSLLIYSNAENMILFTKKKNYKKKVYEEQDKIKKSNKLRTI